MPRQKSRHVDDPKAVGRRLREARERARLSQRELSFPGCSPAYIARIEAGDRIPSLPLLRELGARLGVSEDYLATGAERERAASQNLLDAEIALRLDDVEQARRLYEESLERAGNAGERALALEGLANIALRTGHPREAIDYFSRSIDATADDPCERPSAAENLGRAYAALGEIGPAIELFERCAERYEREGDTVRYVRFAALLGYALTDHGEFERAERVVAEALSVGRELRDPYSRARLFWSQSRLRLEQGDPDVAARYAREALQTLKATEDTYFLGLAHQLLAYAHLDAGRARDALDLLEEGWLLVSGAATPLELAHCEIERPRALAALGEKEEAAALAIDVTERLGDAHPADAGRAYMLVAQIFEELGDGGRARGLYERAIEKLGDTPTRYLVDAYRGLASLLEQEGRSGEALELLKRALAVQERGGRALARDSAALV